MTPLQNRVWDHNPISEPPQSVAQPNPDSVVVAPAEEAEAPEVLMTKNEKLKEDATSISHMMTHVPKNPFCITCQRSKMQAKPATDRKGKRSDGSDKPKGFGTEVTADHFIAKDAIDQPISGDKVGLVIHCRGSDWLDIFACPTNDAGSTETSFINFQGSKDEIKSFYSDDSRD